MVTPKHNHRVRHMAWQKGYGMYIAAIITSSSYSLYEIANLWQFH